MYGCIEGIIRGSERGTGEVANNDDFFCDLAFFSTRQRGKKIVCGRGGLGWDRIGWDGIYWIYWIYWICKWEVGGGVLSGDRRVGVREMLREMLVVVMFVCVWETVHDVKGASERVVVVLVRECHETPAAADITTLV